MWIWLAAAIASFDGGGRGAGGAGGPVGLDLCLLARGERERRAGGRRARGGGVGRGGRRGELVQGGGGPRGGRERDGDGRLGDAERRGGVVVDVQAVGDGLAGALAVADVALDQHRLVLAVGDTEGGAVREVVQRVGIGEGERGVGVVIEQGELGERVGLCGQEGAA